MPKNKYQDSDRSLVGSIWIKESKKGTRYLSIALEDPEDEDRKFSLVGFKNKEKKSENSPDYFIFYSKDDGSYKGRKDKEETEDDDEL